MSVTRLSNLSSKVLILLSFSIFLHLDVIGVEPIDIWKKEKNDKQEITEKENIEKKSKIDYSKKDKAAGQIEITDEDQGKEEPIELSGLYDPEKNNLSMTMWLNTDGISVQDTFKRITKIKLSNFSEELFINTIFTYSYPPKANLSKDKFLELKLKWLVDNNKVDLIEEFLNRNLEFSGKSKLIKHLVDYYIASADISKSCEKANLINKEIKDNYLDKFRIYCLILNKKMNKLN